MIKDYDEIICGINCNIQFVVQLSTNTYYYVNNTTYALHNYRIVHEFRK
jgi:hypothetical protein